MKVTPSIPRDLEESSLYIWAYDTCVLTLDSLTSHLPTPIEYGTPTLPFCVTFQHITEGEPRWQAKSDRNFRNWIAFGPNTSLHVASPSSVSQIFSDLVKRAWVLFVYSVTRIITMYGKQSFLDKSEIKIFWNWSVIVQRLGRHWRFLLGIVAWMKGL